MHLCAKVFKLILLKGVRCVAVGRGGPASGEQQVPLQPQRQEQQQQQHPGQGAVTVGPLSPSHVWQHAGLQVSFGLISPKEK